MKTIQVEFVGISDFGIPTFRNVDRTKGTFFFGDLWTLFSYTDTAQCVKDCKDVTGDSLEYLGTKFNCEPNGGKPYPLEIVWSEELL